MIRNRSSAHRFILPFLLSLVLGLALAGCGGSKDTAAASAATTDPDAPDMEANLAKTVAEQSDFYLRKPVSAIPADLTWQDGADVPEFADPAAKKGGSFYYYIPDFPRTLRTIGPDATGGIRPYLLDYVEAMFLYPHPNIPGAVYPGLADRWAVDHANKTLYIHIDPAARWSDGKEITTADVEFTFFFMRSPDLNEPWYNDFYTNKFTNLTIYDDLTFSLTFPEDKPDLDARFGNFCPYPRHAYKDFGPGWLERFQWRVTPKTGPYQLFEKDIDKGRGVTLTRLKDWWGKDKRFFRYRFNPDRYHLDVIRDPEKRVEAFARGDIDYLELNRPNHWYENINDEHPEVASGRIQRYKFFNRIPRPGWGLWVNSSKPVLSEQEIRLGLNYATNFQLVCDQYFRGDAVQMNTRSDGYGWRMHPTITHRPFDTVKAREHFAAAGYTQQGPDGVLMNEAGQRLSFTITAYSQNYRDILAILKQDALKAGVEYNLEILDSTTGYKKMQEKNHEIALVALSRSVELYPRYWEMFHGNNAYEDAYLGPDGQPVNFASEGTPNPNPTKIRVQTNNMTETFIPELDRLIEAYVKAETLDEIKSLAAQIEEIIHDDGAWIPGWALPFYRGGHWRYVHFPQDFNVAGSRTAEEFFVHWVDSDERDEIERARRTGETYPNELQVYDQFQEK